MKHIHAISEKQAWEIADSIFPTDYLKNDKYSNIAGYEIYTSTLKGNNSWISDLGCRLEVNIENQNSIVIWFN